MNHKLMALIRDLDPISMETSLFTLSNDLPSIQKILLERLESSSTPLKEAYSFRIAQLLSLLSKFDSVLDATTEFCKFY